MMKNKMKSWIKKNDVWVLLGLELVILLVAGMLYMYQIKHLASLHFSEEEIASFDSTQSDACFGGTITEDHNSGLYDIIPDMWLEKGYYHYTVSYETDAEGSFCWPHSYVNYYDMMEQAVTYMEPGVHTREDEFWLNVDLDVALRLYYSGSGTVTVTEFGIEETPVAANRMLFGVITLLLLADLLYFYRKWERKHPVMVSSKYVFFGLLGIGLFASYPLFLGYAINGHDFYFHLTRIEGLMEGLKSGQFPVRINPTFYNGYGYANPIFYGEILLYIPAFLRMAGFRLTTCYNLYGILVNLLTTFVAYYSFHKIFRKQNLAICCTALYVLAPYRIMDMYLRAAVGEYSAMIFLPLVAYGLYRIYQEDVKAASYKWSFLPLVIGLSGIIHTHVLTGEMTGGVILVTCVLLLPRTLQKERFLALCKTVVVTFLLNAWFLVPFLDFSLTQDIRVLQSPSYELIQKTGTYVTQMIGLFSKYVWENRDAEMGISNEMPLNFGLPLVIGLFLFVMMWFLADRKRAERKRGLVFLALTLMVLWMATIYFPWDHIATAIPFTRTMIASIQFIWRFLALATTLGTVATGFGLYLLEQERGKTYFVVAAVSLGLLSGIAAMQFMQACVWSQGPVIMNTIEDLSGIDTTVTATAGEYVLRGVRYELVTEVFEPRCYDGVAVTEYEKRGTNVQITVENDATEGYVLLPLLNYKGYRISSADGQITNAQLTTGEGAVIRIVIPADYAGTIRVKYVGEWYWRVAELISVVTVLALLYLRFGRGKKQKS